MKIGKTNYTGKKKKFKIKDDDNVYAIVPPVGKLADDGVYRIYYRVVWGFKDSDGINRPYLDPRVVNFQTKMVEVESPSHIYREGLKANKELIKEQFKNGQANREELTIAVDLVKRYNLEAKYYLNVVNLQGEMGLLKIGTRAKQGLDVEIANLRKQGIDPISIDNGRFFNFNRTGKNFDTLYKVSTYTENVQATINGVPTVVQQPKIFTMDENMIGRLGREVFELSGMYPEVTPDQEQRFLDEGVPAIEEVLGKAKDKKVARAAAEATEAAANQDKTTTQPVAEKAVEQRSEAVAETPETPETQVAETVAAQTTTPVVDKVVTEQVQVVAKETVTAAKETVAAATDPNNMSDDAFLKSIGC